MTKIVTESSDVVKRCKRIIIQPKFIDDKVMFAQQIFVGLIQTKVPLEIIDDEKKVQETISNLRKRPDQNSVSSENE